MKQLPGFQQNISSSSLVCKLHNTIYELEQAPQAWFHRLQDFLILSGFCNFEGWPFYHFKVHKQLNYVYFGVCWQDKTITGSFNGVVTAVVKKLDAEFLLKIWGIF